MIRITEHGWEYEPDQRHAEMIVEAMGLQKAKGVSTPAEDEKPWEEQSNEEELCTDKATTFRRIAARPNYLAATTTRGCRTYKTYSFSRRHYRGIWRTPSQIYTEPIHAAFRTSAECQ